MTYKCECGRTYTSPLKLSAPPTCSIDKKSNKPHLRPKVMKPV